MVRFLFIYLCCWLVNLIKVLSFNRMTRVDKNPWQINSISFIFIVLWNTWPYRTWKVETFAIGWDSQQSMSLSIWPITYRPLFSTTWSNRSKHGFLLIAHHVVQNMVFVHSVFLCLVGYLKKYRCFFTIIPKFFYFKWFLFN